MAGPITWRNVSSGGGINPGALLASGGQAVQQGLASLQALADRQMQLNVRNQQNLREVNTQDYLDQVAQVNDPTQLADPAVQAGLEATRQGYGNLIDRARTRSAVNQQLQTLQNQQLTADKFTDEQTERGQRGLVEQAYTLARNGDTKGVKSLLDSTNFLDEGKLGAQLDQVIDNGTNRQYRAEDQARQNRQEQRSITAFNAQLADQADNRQFRNEQRALSRNDREVAGNVALADAKLAENNLKQQLAIKMNPGGAISQDPTTDTNVLMKQLDDAASPWLRDNNTVKTDTQNKIQGLLTDGVEIDDGKGSKVRIKVTPAQMQQYIEVHKDDTNVFGNPGAKGGSIDQYFKELFTRNPDLAVQSLNSQNALSTLRAEQADLLGNKTSAISKKTESLDSILKRYAKKPNQSDK
jgi:hypothetical protein